MGEARLRRKNAELEPACSVGLQTAGGRVNVRWDASRAATPMVHRIPHPHRFVGALEEPAIRCDGVNPPLLGMTRIVSEDALRRALKAIDPDLGAAWLDKHLRNSTRALLDAPWILDIDTTIKPLYGRQQGALVSYNPHKPGRPSHAYHTYLMAGTRVVLGIEVKAGNEHAARHSLPGLLHLLETLTPEQRPRIVRGDCGFGSDTVMRSLEERGQSYLFKLRLSKNVKRHIERMFAHEGWTDAGQGWEGLDGSLSLMGWDSSRRVVLIRRALAGKVAFTCTDDRQQVLGFVEIDPRTGKRICGYEYAVLVTNLDHEVLTLGQLYRDRPDAENSFDELKNQWGWGGFTTHDLHRCGLSARAVALVYNWWSLYVRLANPGARREAITTTRPWLMTSVGRRTEHAGQATITLTSMHAEFHKAREALVRVSRLLQAWARQAAEQLDGKSVWIQCCEYLRQILAAIGRPKKAPAITLASG